MIMTIASVMNNEPIPSVTLLAMNKTLHEMATLRARSCGSDVILPRHLAEAARRPRSQEPFEHGHVDVAGGYATGALQLPLHGAEQDQ
jgi:hypothetical protein